MGTAWHRWHANGQEQLPGAANCIPGPSEIKDHLWNALSAIKKVPRVHRHYSSL